MGYPTKAKELCLSYYLSTAKGIPKALASSEMQTASSRI